MGDNIIISNIEFIYNRLFQIDLYNESRDEHYRLFAKKEELYDMLNSAISNSEVK